MTILGEQAGIVHRALQALASGHFIPHAHDAVFVHDVAGGAGHRFQGLDQGHARREHRGQGARVAGQRGLVEDGADDRKLEAQAVEHFAHLA
jgi:hypothetical protein